MFSTFRSILDVLQAGSQALQGIAVDLQAALAERKNAGELVDRLEDLELSRAKWEAEMEAELLRAQSTLRSANNAESRARTMVRRYEEDADGGFKNRDRSPDSMWIGPDDDVAPSEAAELPPDVRIEADAKALATRFKFG